MGSRRQRRGKNKDKSPKKEEVVVKTAKKVEKKQNPILEFYDKQYKALMIIPFAILLLSFIMIGIQISETGDFIDKDVSLKGGLTLTILTEEIIDANALETQLNSEFTNGDVRVRAITDLGTQVGLIVDSSDIDKEKLISSLENKVDLTEYSAETIGASLGDSFFKQTMISILVAFIFMALVVFYYFRTLVPSLAVVLAAFSDMIVTIAVMNFMEIKLSTAGIAALLMLIGYSVDTDILLSTRVLKNKEGSVMDRIVGALKTGLTMNATTLASISVALFLTESETIKQIMTILLIGLVIDVINTWIQNVGILKWYLEAKQ